MSKFKTVSLNNACAAMTSYLQTMRLIADGEEVTGITKAPGALDLKIEIKPIKD